MEIMACGILMLLRDPLGGGAAVCASLLCFFYYYFVATRKFGGITGDLAGWFLQLCELFLLAALVVVQVLERMWG